MKVDGETLTEQLGQKISRHGHQSVIGMYDIDTAAQQPKKALKRQPGHGEEHGLGASARMSPLNDGHVRLGG
ncbi:MAG: hypothetical protein ACREJM_05115, partial [Candidatus Saccharimonadales bacterium]